jgi:uncharacterized OsmC-like protein
MHKPAPKGPKRINGISVRSVFDTIDAIRSSPSLGKTQFRARNVWLDGGHTRTIVKDYYAAGSEQASRRTPLVSESDLPGVLRGGDQAPSPLEKLLVALSACVTTTLVTQAALRYAHVDMLEVRASGDIDVRGFLGVDEDVQRGFQHIRLDVRLDAEVPAPELDHIVLQGIRFSPVFSTIAAGTTIDVYRDGKLVQE